MSRAVALLIIGLVFGGGIGFILAAANGVTLDGHDHATDHGQGKGAHSDHKSDDSAHDHSKTRDITGPAPTLAIDLLRDPVSGWNLHIMTTNFTFSPSSAGAAHVNGEGHAHIYANGAKIARVYGPWFHIAALPEGQVDLSVTLNSNDHSTLAVAGTPLMTAITVLNPPQSD